MIPYGHQAISDEDIAAVVEVLRSDFLTQGPAVERFERALAEACGAKHAVAVSSGTAALHLAALAAGIGPGDSLWTSPVTFVASANCARYCGGDVDFVDIDPVSWNLSVAALEEKLAGAKRPPKVIVPVHLGGVPCDMDAIGKLARSHGSVVIEDASHALGASTHGAAVGKNVHADMTVFSFHPVKIVTTCEGGAITTNRDDLHERLVRLRTHGITRDPRQMVNAPHGSWYYEQLELGFNYRISDVHAALGTSQLKRLPAFVARRNELASEYQRRLAELPLRWQAVPTGVRSAYHLFVIRANWEACGGQRAAFEAMRAAKVGVNLHYIPVHLQPYYARLGFHPGQFPEAEAYYREAMTLPLHVGLTGSELDQIIGALNSVLRPASMARVNRK
jgi:UDP-4-amino-4,6-dideoxy-N-acetyl-beta-L-altrosamine transaminase